jgi:hypothetical protein
MYISACLINVIFTLLIIYCLFNSVLTPSNVVTYMKGVEKLRGRGANFTKWKSELMLIFAIMDRDNSFHEDKLVPISEGDNDTTAAARRHVECKRLGASTSLLPGIKRGPSLHIPSFSPLESDERACFITATSSRY